MRLIDIDSDEYILSLYYPFNYKLDDYEDFMVITDYDIQDLPKVNAIPIEWVNKWIKEHESWGWGEATFTSSVEIMVSDFLNERSDYLLPGFTVTPNAERKEK